MFVIHKNMLFPNPVLPKTSIFMMEGQFQVDLGVPLPIHPCVHLCWAIIENKIFIQYRYIWVWGRHSSIQHDSYLCKTFRGSQPFPTQRINEPNNFIASVFVDNATLWKKCPPACRPKEHQDWEHC